MVETIKLGLKENIAHICILLLFMFDSSRNDMRILKLDLSGETPSRIISCFCMLVLDSGKTVHLNTCYLIQTRTMTVTFALFHVQFQRAFHMTCQ